MAKKKLNLYYQYNAEGIYIGPVEAETCPENATEKAPEPNGDDNLSAIWNGAAWLYLPNVTIEKAAAIRAKRDALLAGSDYTQLPDADVDPEAWASYRQALRDLTKGEDFPLSVTWPTKPTGKRPEPKPSPLEEKLAAITERVKTLESKKAFPATGPAAKVKAEDIKVTVGPVVPAAETSTVTATAGPEIPAATV
jgi:hypothetical protein